MNNLQVISRLLTTPMGEKIVEIARDPDFGTALAWGEGPQNVSKIDEFLDNVEVRTTWYGKRFFVIKNDSQYAETAQHQKIGAFSLKQLVAFALFVSNPTRRKINNRPTLAETTHKRIEALNNKEVEQGWFAKRLSGLFKENLEKIEYFFRIN